MMASQNGWFVLVCIGLSWLVMENPIIRLNPYLNMSNLSMFDLLIFLRCPRPLTVQTPPDKGQAPQFKELRTDLSSSPHLN